MLFVIPPYLSLLGFATDTGYTVGITSLAAYLREKGIESAGVNADLFINLSTKNKWLSMDSKKMMAGQRDYERILDDDNHFIWKKITDLVNQKKPRAVGITYLSPTKCSVDKVARLIKQIDRDIKIITGSSHPTFCSEDVIRNPDIDFAVIGEGEVTLFRIIEELKKDKPRWETVPGISYRDEDGQVKKNPNPPPIPNLDGLPFPARDLMLDCDYKHYRVHSVATARGCPYSCSFCADRRFWKGKIRRRSVKNVMEELRLLKRQYHPSVVEFTDGTFTYDRKYLEAFCHAMIDQKPGIEWQCTARYDNLDEGLLKLMKKAGCGGLYFGLESGSQRVLDITEKKQTIEEVIKVSKMVYDAGIPVATSVLLGVPDETKEEIEETLKIMKVVKTDIYDVHFYVPLPGSSLYEAMSEEDRKNIDWRKVGYKSYDNYFSKKIPQVELQKYYTEAYKIADVARNKTVMRYAIRTLFSPLTGLFKH